MKKFYLFLAMAFVAFTATAMSPANIKGLASSKNFKVEKSHAGKTSNFRIHKSAEETKLVTRAVGPVNPEIAGDWTFYFGDWWFEDASGLTVYAIYNAVYEEENYDWWFESQECLPFMLEETPVPGELELGNWIITGIEDENGEILYLSQEPFTYNPETGEFIDYVDSIPVAYDADEETLLFEEGSGIYWGLYNRIPTGEFEFIDDYYAFDIYGGVKGDQSSEDDGNGAVESIIKDNSETVYYDLQGRKVINPSNGIFIKKQGNKVSKELVK